MDISTAETSPAQPMLGERPKQRNTRNRILAVTAPLSALLLAVAMLTPTGFAVRSPGPTEDTLGAQARRGGSDQEIPLVEVHGAPTFPTSGRMLLTTVSVSGGPISTVTAMDALASWLTESRAVLPSEALFPPQISRADQEEMAAAQMVSSQEAATAAALTELGYEFPVTLSVASAVPDGGAVGVVEPDDELVSINGEPITSHLQLLDELSRVTPGDTAVLGVLRGGQPMDLPIVTGTAETEDGGQRAALGVFVSSVFDFPLDVDIQIENIGGPSAGMMFALAIIDQLTEADELQGQTVAGTGTVEVNGVIGPIGGIEQKMHGALRDGAQYFLAPAGNCPEAVSAIPRGLQVIKVATLHEARSAIEAIGAGTAGSLPTCTA